MNFLGMYRYTRMYLLTKTCITKNITANIRCRIRFVVQKRFILLHYVIPDDDFLKSKPVVNTHF